MRQQLQNLFPLPSSKGQHFELVAERWLQAQGLQPVTRNYRCRGGEIDLIMHQGQTLVFVEVRYRASASHGGAASSVTLAKQRKIMLAARHYLKQHAINEASQACRFDVIAFEGDQPDWIRNAF
ncbi:YraN family protein [Aeromonas jandaei]|uniref:YraN family protein n=1 Tax=Aeromonas jandaei TaxID=650 RepID=UPI00227D0F26|nr:YraN family protein [Aeromonas jandaei]WAG06323.1 YraN family protein [Aeromonas jandaei]